MKLAAKIKKYTVNILAAAVAVFILSVPVCASELPLQNMAVEYTLPNGFTYTVKAFAVDRNKTGEETQEHITDNEYTLVLPYAVKGKMVTVKMAEGDCIYLGETAICNGLDIVLEKGTHRIVSDNKEYNLNVLYTSDIPQLYITIRDGAMSDINEDKDLKEAGTIVITDGSTTQYSGPLEYIKGRGNASWTSRKKPYNIKLGTNANLFNMGASKKYALIASHIETSLIRNRLAMDFADKVGIEFCSSSQHVDVYINNEYAGNYTLAERVEVDSSRVNIFNLDTVNEQANPGVNLAECQQGGHFDSTAHHTRDSYKWVEIPKEIEAEVTGGYLLETEIGVRYINEKAGFVTSQGQPIVLKSPEYASQKQVEYIREYYQQFEDAVMSDNGINSQGKHYSEYVDVKSFAKMYVFQEYAQNLDAGLTSFFIYKNVNGKMVACSVWDMDHALGDDTIKNGVDLSQPENIWAADRFLYGSDSKRTIFTLLWQHADFRREASLQWRIYFRPQIDSLTDTAKDLSDSIHDSAIAEHYLWRKLAYITPDEAEQIYNDASETLYTYLQKRADFMSHFLYKGAKYVIYNRNGASGYMADKFSYMPGSTATLRDNAFVCEEAQFRCWNTEPDGSGTSYMPGDEIAVDNRDIVLYAQWDGDLQMQQTAARPEKSTWDRLLEKLKYLL